MTVDFDIQDALQDALRAAPTSIVVGEVRRGEAIAGDRGEPDEPGKAQ